MGIYFTVSLCSVTCQSSVILDHDFGIVTSLDLTTANVITKKCFDIGKTVELPMLLL
jgi:hypothetical protein